MKDYDVYIFDFDGTLVDSEASLFPVFQAGFAAIGRTCTQEEASSYIHVSLTECMEIAKVDLDKRETFLQAIIQAIDDPKSIAMVRFFDDALPTIQALLSRGKRIGIGSNNVVGHMKLVLEGLQALHYFETIVGSDRVEHPKPAPDVVFKACEDLGMPCNERTVYVGDSLQDAATGNASGGDGILVDRYNAYPEFSGIKISSLKELLL